MIYDDTILFDFLSFYYLLYSSCCIRIASISFERYFVVTCTLTENVQIMKPMQYAKASYFVDFLRVLVFISFCLPKLNYIIYVHLNEVLTSLLDFLSFYCLLYSFCCIHNVSISFDAPLSMLPLFSHIMLYSFH